jgi:hypothetical protein
VVFVNGAAFAAVGAEDHDHFASLHSLHQAQHDTGHAL